MMRFLLPLVFMAGLTATYGQTHPDLDSLGLTEAQMEAAFEKRLLLLSNKVSGKKKKIKEGGFAVIKLVGDTTELEVFMEAFLSDTIIVSTWAPQLEGNEIALQFAGFRLLPIKSIETIEYNVRHEGAVFWSSFVMTIAGLNFAVLPVIMPLILGNTEEAYSQPQFPYLVVGGAILFVVGLKLQKTLNPKVYNIGTDWNYHIVKK